MKYDYANRNPPVEAGEQVDVEIIGVGKQGDGVAKIDKYVVFVPEAGKGETVRIRITKVLPRFAFGEVVK